MSTSTNLSIIHQTERMEVRIPDQYLAATSVVVQPQQGKIPQLQEEYNCLQKFARAISSQFSYLIYNRQNLNVEETSCHRWEFVPFKKADGSFKAKLCFYWKQLKVLWRIVFGGKTHSESTKEQAVQFYKPYGHMFNNGPVSDLKLKQEQKENCENRYFCSPKNRNQQKVIGGHFVDILYDYAPIGFGSNRLHFLITPKEHKESFVEVSSAEYIEGEVLKSEMFKHYQQKGYTSAYCYHKTGKEAGQSVPHWHQHVVFIKDKREDLLGKLSVFKRLIFGASRLSPQKLANRVQQLNAELNFIEENLTLLTT